MSASRGNRASVALLWLVIAAGSTACNAIFGIRPGEETSGTGGTGTTTTSPGGGGTTTVGGSGPGGTGPGGSTSSGTSTGGSGPCAEFPVADGNTTQWVAHPVGNFIDFGQKVARRPDGDVIVAGYYFDEDFEVFPGDTLPYPASALGERENVFVIRYSPEGVPKWAVGFTGQDRQFVVTLAVDPDGNPVVGGYVDVDMQIGATTIVSDKTYGETALDGFVLKLDGETGAPLWAKGMGGVSTDWIAGVATDSQGNVLIAGSAMLGGELPDPPDDAPVDFGCGPRTLTKDTPRVYVTKLDPAGACLWDKELEIDTGFAGLFNPPYGLTISIGPGDTPILAGGFRGIADFGDGTLAASSGSIDVFALRMTPAGDLLWAENWGDDYSQAATLVTTDSSGDFWIGGWFEQSLSLGGGFDATDDTGDADHGTMFIAKLTLDPSDTKAPHPAFLHAFLDKGPQALTTVAATPDGDVVFGGNVVAQDGSLGVDFGDGERISSPGKSGDGTYLTDGFVAKYCTNGGLRWVRYLATTGDEQVHGVAVAPDGSTFVTGSFDAEYDFGGDKDYDSYSYDVFTLRLGP